MKHTLFTAGLLLTFAALTSQLRGELSEPDNIIYGTVTRAGVPLTAADSEVVIAARRLSDGAVVASYRMGDSVRSGNYFTLRIPLEVFTPVLDSLSSQTGEALAISASDFNGVFAEAPFTLGGRGQFHQLNLQQSAAFDSDGDGLSDEWEMYWFGNLFQNSATDKDGDGMSDGQEYLAGTNPNDSGSRFLLKMQRIVSGKEVSFVAQAATGAGYQTKTRIYTLESTTDLANPNWQPVPGYINVLGAGQTLRYTVPETGTPSRFYRVAIQLN